jgi:preprotein translocase subunit SecY
MLQFLLSHACLLGAVRAHIKCRQHWSSTTDWYVVSLTLQASTENSSNLAVYVLAFFLTTMGIVYVQEAERKIPMNYASRYRTGSLGRQSYLPFKVRRGWIDCCA